VAHSRRAAASTLFSKFDAHLPPGFSGGPLLAADGRALGMNTSGLVRAARPFRTPRLTRVVGEILEHGSIRRRHLGVGVYPVEQGLVVLSVQRGGPPIPPV